METTRKITKTSTYIENLPLVAFGSGLFAQASQLVPSHAHSLLNPDYMLDPQKDWEKKFDSFSFKIYEKGGHVLPYRFYQPPTLESGMRYPLVLFLHGAGERGMDNRTQFLRFGPVPFWEKTPCFIIAPQCPSKPSNGEPDIGWVQTTFGAATHTMKEKPTWTMELAIEMLEKTIAENPVDTHRVYVTGLSMGGFGTWEIIQRKREFFAAAMPVCGGGDPAFASKLADLPLWVFHGTLDDTVKVERSRDMVAAITAASGKPNYTEYPNVKHDAWDPAYSDPKTWEWLFTQLKK
ncbi:MAG: prolyl oligopeptidase family serine peptidase [Verrucomicrobiota bacterium]